MAVPDLSPRSPVTIAWKGARAVIPYVTQSYNDKIVIPVPDGSVVLGSRQPVQAATAFSTTPSFAVKNVTFLPFGPGKNFFGAMIFSSDPTKEVSLKWRFRATQNGRNITEESQFLRMLPSRLLQHEAPVKEVEAPTHCIKEKVVSKKGGGCHLTAPTITMPHNPITREQAINDLLESIALEEVALAHILNAEGEKIQYSFAHCATIKDLINIDNAVMGVITSVIKSQMLLQFKLEEVSRILADP